MGTPRDLTEPSLAFCVLEQEQPTFEVRVNFGVFAGRNATQAEIDHLARSLNEIVGSFTIVAEERHEFGEDVEAMVRQIVVEVDGDHDAADKTILCERMVARAEQWASACIADRADLGDLSDL
jgi:hypothetical protein